MQDILKQFLVQCSYSHIVWLPDSFLGVWEEMLENMECCPLIRVAREGEAIGLAGGLLLGGAKPLVIMQSTGFFEAGDALRNIVHDLQLPLHLLLGARSYQKYQQKLSLDSAARFIEPIVRAWDIPFAWIDPNADRGTITSTLQTMATTPGPFLTLIAE